MGNSDIVTSIISPGPGESVDYQVGTTGGGGGDGCESSPATGGHPARASAWMDEKLREERTRHHAVELAHEALCAELRADSDRLLQRALDAEEQAVRWFKMSKDLLAVAGEFAKLMAKP